MSLVWAQAAPFDGDPASLAHDSIYIVACQAHPTLRFLPMLVLVSSHLFNGLKGGLSRPFKDRGFTGDPTSLARDNIYTFQRPFPRKNKFQNAIQQVK